MAGAGRALVRVPAPTRLPSPSAIGRSFAGAAVVAAEPAGDTEDRSFGASVCTPYATTIPPTSSAPTRAPEKRPIDRALLPAPGPASGKPPVCPFRARCAAPVARMVSGSAGARTAIGRSVSNSARTTGTFAPPPMRITASGVDTACAAVRSVKSAVFVAYGRTA